MHETVALQGRTGQLAAPLEHCTIPDMQTFLRKGNEYTTLEALAFEREGRRQRAVDLAVRPVWTFLKLYLGKQGFRDGLEGFVFCVVSALSDLARRWKYRERIRLRIRTGGTAS